MKLRTTTLLAASALLAATAAMAQDIPGEAAYDPAAGVPDAAPESVSTPMLEDQGEAIVLAAQTENVAIPPKPALTAEDAVRDDLRKHGLRTGYNPDKDVIIGMGVAYFTSPNPAEDPDFIAKRDLKAMEAYLAARASVGRGIAQTFSASARSELVPNDDPDPLAKAMAAKKKEVEELKAELEKKLAELDAAEAAALHGVTLMDRLDAFLDGVVQKINSLYNPAAISQEKIDRCNALKAEVAKLKAAYAELGEATEAAFPKVKATSQVDSEVLASMRFFGCVAQAQSEAWNPKDKTYEVAIAVVWSRKLHKLALASLTGDGSVKGKPGSLTFENWLDAQDFSSMVGSRQMTDNQGRKYFVGIGAARCPDKAVERREARALAQENARVAAMFAMLGEGASHREAKRSMTELDDDTSFATAKLAETIALQIKGQVIEGMDERDVFTLVNPSSGQPIYVAVMAINPALAAQSQDMQNTTAAGAIEQDAANKYRIGANAGREAAINAAREDQRAYEAGVEAGISGTTGKLPPPSMHRAGGQPAAPSIADQKTAPQGGVFTGDNGMDLDF